MLICIHKLAHLFAQGCLQDCSLAPIARAHGKTSGWCGETLLTLQLTSHALSSFCELYDQFSIDTYISAFVLCMLVTHFCHTPLPRTIVAGLFLEEDLHHPPAHAISTFARSDWAPSVQVGLTKGSVCGVWYLSGLSDAETLGCL